MLKTSSAMKLSFGGAKKSQYVHPPNVGLVFFLWMFFFFCVPPGADKSFVGLDCKRAKPMFILASQRENNH